MAKKRLSVNSRDWYILLAFYILISVVAIIELVIAVLILEMIGGKDAQTQLTKTDSISQQMHTGCIYCNTTDYFCDSTDSEVGLLDEKRRSLQNVDGGGDPFSYNIGSSLIGHDIDYTIDNDVVPASDISDIYLTEEDVYMLGKIVLAEAPDEDELGKRLVVSTVLNRVDHPNFPNTVKEVIFQENQFTPVWNGRYDSMVPTEDILQMVRKEINERSNLLVIFFRADYYHEVGTPLFVHGCHYFSGYGDI